jgi:hypothetical protein
MHRCDFRLGRPRAAPVCSEGAKPLLVVSASATKHARRPAMVQDFVPAPRRYSKKSSRRVPPAAFFAAAPQDCQCLLRLTRGRRGRGGLTPPFTSPSPPFTQCYRRGPFWPASGATARPPVPSESPTCDGPMAAPRQRLGPALTPVDAAPRRLPLREDRYSTWGDARAVLPSGKPRPRFKVGMLGIRPGTCRAALPTPNRAFFPEASGC